MVKKLNIQYGHQMLQMINFQGFNRKNNGLISILVQTKHV